jgi:precorrin-8X/cobalt-precorrin-8 methylmutase
MSPAPFEYERDGEAIYRESFATIRHEAAATLSRLGDVEPVAVRMIHAAGDTGIAAQIDVSPGFVTAARAALQAGAPIYCDSQMVVHGITRRRLPAKNALRCTLSDPGVAETARALGTTRSAAAVDRWVPGVNNAIAVVGNAPTALFRLLELVLDGVARPAAIVGVPVGFVGAAESKHALANAAHGVPFLTLHGRRGGSAVAAAAVNALAADAEILT